VVGSDRRLKLCVAVSLAAGVIASIPLAVIALSRRVTSFRRRSTGVVVALALLPTSLGHRCRRGAGVAWASVPPRRWRRLGITPLWLWRCRSAGTVAIVAWALLPSRRWRHRGCRYGHHRHLVAGVVAVVTMAPSRR